MTFLYLKSFHIIFVVTWFAGLFYIVRLFVYYSESTNLPEPKKTILHDQFKLMQKRLWMGIAWPSAIITMCLGIALTFQYGTIPNWLWIKLGFVAGLFSYHLFCHRIYAAQQKGKALFSSLQLRVINEVATIFLFAIVFIVVLKNTFSWVYGLLGLGIITAMLLLGINIYKKLRG